MKLLRIPIELLILTVTWLNILWVASVYIARQTTALLLDTLAIPFEKTATALRRLANYVEVHKRGFF